MFSKALVLEQTGASPALKVGGVVEDIGYLGYFAGSPTGPVAGVDRIRKTLQLGRPPVCTLRDLYRTLLQRGYRVSPETKDVICQPGFFFSGPGEVDLVSLYVWELGFDDTSRIPYSDVVSGALNRGFGLCPHDAALVLRTNLPLQREDTWMHVCMSPIIDSAGVPRTFVLGSGRPTPSGPCLWVGSAPVVNRDGTHPSLASDQQIILAIPKGHVDSERFLK